MKKPTKFLMSLTSALLIAGNTLALTSCGDSGVSGIVTGNVDAVAYDGSAVTISFYHTMGSALKGILAECIADFNELYPNIKVQPTSYGDYPGVRDQISTELSSGNAPSLAYCYPDHVALYNKSLAVLDLDDYIASTAIITRKDGSTEQFGLTQAQIDDYIPLYYNEGKMYGDIDNDGSDDMLTLPMLKSTELLYYNKTYFTNNNLTVPTTWEEMENVCKQILAIEGAKEGGLAKNPCIPLGYDSGANWFITMTEQLGSGYTSSKKGEYFLFNNETNQQFVEDFRAWYKAGYVTTEEAFGSYTSDLFKETTQTKVKSFMCIGSSAGATYQRPDKLENGKRPFEVGVAMIPQKDPNNPKMISQGPSLCLFKKQNGQEMAAAWLFAKYLTTSVTYQANFSENNGYAPVINGVNDDPLHQDFLANADGYEFLQASAIKLTKDFAKTGTYYYISPAFNGSSTARDEMASLLKNCFMQTPENGQTEKQMIANYFNKTYDTLKKKYDK